MTTHIQRQQLLATLAEVWGLSEDVRLGQLMAHLGFLGEAHADHGLGDIEDDELLAIMYRHRNELKARLVGAPAAAPGMPLSISGSPITALSTPTSDAPR
jgi:hypothetical protein